MPAPTTMIRGSSLLMLREPRGQRFGRYPDGVPCRNRERSFIQKRRDAEVDNLTCVRK